MRANLRQVQGFTLLELLLAIAIFAMVSLASFSILDTAISASERSTDKVDRLNELNRAFLVMERDFIQLAQRTMRINGEAPLPGYLHVDTEGVFSDATALAFVRTGWTNPGLLLPRSDLQPVAYQLNEQKLERLSFNFVDPITGQEAKKRVLINDVEQLSFQFFTNDKWHEVMQGDQLPRAIAVIITTADLGEIRRQFLLPRQIQSRNNNAAGGGSS